MIELISAFGFGALATAIFQSFFNIYQNKRMLSFQEKKEAYVGLLEAYHKSAIENSSEAAKNFAYWQIRCELVGNRAVSKAIQDILDTNENRMLRIKAYENLKDALRKDLGIAS